MSVPEPEVAPPARVIAFAATPRGRGAIAMVQLHGPATALDGVLASVTGGGAASPHRTRGISLRSLAGLDEGLVVRLSAESAWIMPHGGSRIVVRLGQALAAAGAVWLQADEADPRMAFPEASDPVEAMALAAAAAAPSPLAIPLLLDQASRWRKDRSPFDEEDRSRSRRLQRLLRPPQVVLVGPANAGKSSLTNALAGRRISIESDRPGTTRDYTSVPLDLAGLRVEWRDTPGLRESDDPIEREAIGIAAEEIAAADLVVLLAAPDQRWAGEAAGDGPETLRVLSKCDLDPARRSRIAADADLSTSVRSGEGLAELAAAIRERLVPSADLAHPGRWRFDDRLPLER